MADSLLPQTIDAVKLNVGHKIRGVRVQLGVSQEYLSSELGIGQSALSKIETGESLITFERLYEISIILNVNVNLIINFDKDILFTSCTQSGLHNNYNYNGVEEVRAAFELLIEEKNQRIQFLEQLLLNTKR